MAPWSGGPLSGVPDPLTKSIVTVGSDRLIKFANDWPAVYLDNKLLLFLCSVAKHVLYNETGVSFPVDVREVGILQLSLSKATAKIRLCFIPQKNICGDKILFLSLQNQNDDVMPTLMNVFGLRFFFYSEEHLPMHVHIQNSDGKAKIALNPDVVLVENHGIKPHDIKRAIEIARMYQMEFIKAWEEYHGE